MKKSNRPEISNKKTSLPRDGGKPDSKELVKVLQAHRYFGLYAQRELKRAERYCEFLSLLVLELQKPSTKSAATPADLKVLSKDLAEYLGRSVRETDLVSGLEENRLGLLLLETPGEGARCAATRLEEGVRSYLQKALKTTSPKYKLKVLSFPDRLSGREDISSAIRRFLD